MDSISNGADDDGTGSVSVLEIAEAFAKGPIKPKRSIIFIWQMGEEHGLWGSEYFSNHPTTMSRDSIIADLNIDMVGRGEATDVTGAAKDVDPATGVVLHGAPNYVQLVGSRRLSTEFGDIAEAVNKTEKTPLLFDYSMDANGHPQNIYCRSDHANYARYNIPVIFFTTGGHADYHQVTDEPEYIRYQHMAMVDQLIFDIAVKVADLDHRVVVDKARTGESPFARASSRSQSKRFWVLSSARIGQCRCARARFPLFYGSPCRFTLRCSNRKPRPPSAMSPSGALRRTLRSTSSVRCLPRMIRRFLRPAPLTGKRSTGGCIRCGATSATR